MTLLPSPPRHVLSPWGPLRGSLSLRDANETLSVVIVDVAQPGAPLHDALGRLPPAEAKLSASWAPKRQATFASGRLALRQALVSAGVAADVVAAMVIGRDDRGAPVVPPLATSQGHLVVSASITHKDHIAAAVVVTADACVGGVVGAGGGVAWGLDLEIDDGRARNEALALARMVLVDDELKVIDTIDDDAAFTRGVFVRFSLKEALYKGLDPFLRRYVGFKEVGVVVDAAGAAAFRVPFAGISARGFVVAGLDDPDVVLTAARVTMTSRGPGVDDG